MVYKVLTCLYVVFGCFRMFQIVFFAVLDCLGLFRLFQDVPVVLGPLM